MPDRIPQLDDLANSAKEAPMLPAAEIRRLGNQRRLHRQALVSVAAVGIFAVGSVAAWNSPMMASLRGPQWAQAPGPAAPTTDAPLIPMTTPSQDDTDVPMPDPNNPGPPAPTWDNVPMPDLFAADRPDQPDLITNERESLGDVPVGVCAPDGVGTPNRVLMREFGGNETADKTYRWAVVLGYASVDEAITGFQAITDAAKGCAERLTADGMTASVEDLTARADFDRGKDTDLSEYLAQGVRPDESGLYSETVALRSGARVLWVSTTLENDAAFGYECVPNADPDLPRCEVPGALPQLLDLLDN
ncbi:MAG: hypothetical protein QM713_14730 [Arachnia sp.]